MAWRDNIETMNKDGYYYIKNMDGVITIYDADIGICIELDNIKDIDVELVERIEVYLGYNVVTFEYNNKRMVGIFREFKSFNIDEIIKTDN